MNVLTKIPLPNLASLYGTMLAGIDQTRAAIEAAHRPDGFNIGINVGKAAGQTVFHLHARSAVERLADDTAARLLAT